VLFVSKVTSEVAESVLSGQFTWVGDASAFDRGGEDGNCLRFESAEPLGEGQAGQFAGVVGDLAGPCELSYSSTDVWTKARNWSRAVEEMGS